MRIAIWAWLPLILGLGTASRAAAEDALIERHIEWLGGRGALESWRSLSASGALATAGLEGTSNLRQTREGGWRRETHLGAISILEVRNPTGGWVVNWTGQVEDMSAEQKTTGDREAGRLFGRHLLGGLGAEREDLGSETRDERAWRVLRFRFAGGDFFDLFLDPADGSCTWVREHQDTETFWLRLSDWRLVEGRRIPFRQQTFHDDPKLDSTLTWSHVEVDGAVTTADFAEPTPRGGVFTLAGGATSTPWVPAELVDRHYVFLRGAVAGHATSLLMDSGASVSVIDRRFARQIGLVSAGTLRLDGTSQGQEASVAAGVTVEIGSLRLADLTVVVTDLESVDQALGRPVPFLLGKEVFNSLVVEIDYPGSRVAFHGPAAFRPDPAAHRLDLVPGESGGKMVEVSVEDLPPALFALDTGSGSVLTLFKDYADEHRLLASRTRRSERLLRGIGGGSGVPVATLERISLGGFVLESVPVEFFAGEQGAFHTRRAAGNLGAGALDRFRVAFDFRGNRMFLTPGPDWNRKPFCKNRVGLDTDFRGSYLEVMFVSPGSPASAAGWQVGQRIVAIDHRPVGADYLTTDAAFWWCGPPGEPVVLTDAEGKDHRLVFADYY